MSRRLCAFLKILQFKIIIFANTIKKKKSITKYWMNDRDLVVCLLFSLSLFKSDFYLLHLKYLDKCQVVYWFFLCHLALKYYKKYIEWLFRMFFFLLSFYMFIKTWIHFIGLPLIDFIEFTDYLCVLWFWAKIDI